MMKLAAVGIVVMALGSGCTSAQDDADLAAGDASVRDYNSQPLPCGTCDASEYRYRGAGSYRVPVDPAVSPALLRAATTAVAEVDLRVRDQRVELRYDLPIELTGRPQELTLVGAVPVAGHPWVLDGNLGTATCNLGTRDAALTITCDEHLPGVIIDRTALAAVLADRALPAREVDAHLAIAEFYSEDPVGIFEAALRADD